jgi:hypothetical protein
MGGLLYAKCRLGINKNKRTRDPNFLAQEGITSVAQYNFFPCKNLPR